MKLLFLTQNYPLQEDEKFPDLEIQFLAEAFEEVVIAPTMKISSPWESRYPLPKNVRWIADVCKFKLDLGNSKGFVRKHLDRKTLKQILANTFRLGILDWRSVVAHV